jgi:hypothetical protein
VDRFLAEAMKEVDDMTPGSEPMIINVGGSPEFHSRRETRMRRKLPHGWTYNPTTRMYSVEGKEVSEQEMFLERNL